MRRALVVLALAGAAVVFPAAVASAHPLGNFTVSQYSGLVVQPGAVAVDLVVDMAEIPAFQTRGDIDTDGDGHVDETERSAYHVRACRDLTGGLHLEVDGRRQRLGLRSSEVSFPPGQAGLPTLRLSCRLAAGTGGYGRRITYSNRNYADRVGWREITATGDGVDLVAADVPGDSVSGRLTRYPNDLLQSPLDQRRATLRVAPAGPAPGGDSASRTGGPASSPALAPRQMERFTAAFTSLVARQDLSFGFALFALAASVVLGALHALAPGHGKTVMAAYLVGQRGSLRQAATLGLTVTVTHTAGVLVLGLLLSASTGFVPERLYPWLRLASGLLLAAVGAGLLIRTLRQRRSGPGGPGGHADHDHGPAGHDAGHEHRHHHDHHVTPDGPGMSRRALAAMGAAGGMVPSPSALVVLLGAIALGRTWFGVALVLGYGVGMTLSLLATGMLLARFRGVLDTRLRRDSQTPLAVLGRVLPTAAAALVVVVGLGIAAQAVGQV